MNKALNKAKKELISQYRVALENYTYQNCIDLFKKTLTSNQELNADLQLKLKLGTLYDHRAMQVPRRQKSILEQAALKLYRNVLKSDPVSPQALWAIGRVYWHRKDKKAIYYANRAYKAARKKKLPTGLYIQNIGLIYDSLGNTRKGEVWLLKGMRASPREWGCYYNLFHHYKKIKDEQKARLYAKKLKIKISRMPKRTKNTRWKRDIIKLLMSSQ